MKRTIILTAFALTLTFAARSQQMLTLDECRKMAIESNTDQAIAEQNALKAQYTIKAMRANYLPKFSLNGIYAYTDANSSYTMTGGYLPTFVPSVDGSLQPNLIYGADGMPVTGADGNPIFKEYAYFPDVEFKLKMESVWRAGVQVEQPIYMGGKITAAYRMAKQGGELAGQNKRLSSFQVMVKCDEAYVNCVRAKQMVAAAQEYSDTAEELRRVVENAVAAGMRSNNDKLKVDVACNDAALTLLRATNSLKLAKLNLCYVTGMDMTSVVDVADTFEQTGVVDQPISIADRPEYAMLEHNTAIKKQQERITQAEFLPNVAVAGTYGYTNGVKLNDSKMFDRFSYAVLAKASIPLFHWGEGVNKVRSARAETQIARLQQSDAERKMELEALQAQNAMREAAAEVELTERALQQAEENMRTSRNRYDVGLETTADLLEARTQHQKALSEAIGARATLALSRTVYMKAAGLLPDFDNQ